MCAIRAGQRGRRVLVLDHANRVGKKILMSGGGRCNFTNMYSSPENFLCRNPHFPKSALSRYTPWDFIALVAKHGIPWHEKKLGQLFCDNKASDIVNLLLAECDAVQAAVRTHCQVENIEKGDRFTLTTSDGYYGCESLVIATGGLSIPTMGATGFGYHWAEHFGLNVHPTRAGLVPFTLDKNLLAQLDGLSGVSADTETRVGDTGFRENILWTHRGLSGPAILQASSYWQPGETVAIDLLPGQDVKGLIDEARRQRPRVTIKTLLADHLPRRVVERWCRHWLPDKRLADLSTDDMETITAALQPWRIKPAGTEGYRTAEVTLGGVDTDELSSKTLEAKKVPGLYFIGEVVDVTGHLGGHNFQWAWASGSAAGEYA